MTFQLAQQTRRQFLSRGTFGVGSVALACLLQQDKLLAVPQNVPLDRQTFDLTPKIPALPPRAQAMISLFMHGGPSQVDLLDPKPVLAQRDGESYDGQVVFSFFNRATSTLLRSPWKFKQHGESWTKEFQTL